MNVIKALERSCDVFFYEVALKTGIQRIKNMALRLGLGFPTGSDIPGEKPGIIPSHDWKLATHGVVWTPGETVNAGIGQGYVLTTPLQLAVMIARLANAELAVTPSLQVLARPALCRSNVLPRNSVRTASPRISNGPGRNVIMRCSWAMRR